MSSGLYSHTTRATGTVLTAAIYNADHQNHITNLNPSMSGGYADNLAQFQLTVDPGGIGTESLPANLAGELERIRFAIKRITGEAQWYIAPATDLASVGGAIDDLVVSQTVSLQGDLSPAQITVNQNNYAPTNHADAFRFRLSSDAARDITGLAGGANGRLIGITNIGSFTITLKSEDGASSAANRFATSSDIILYPGQGFALQYDSTSSRWRPFSSARQVYSDFPELTAPGNPLADHARVYAKDVSGVTKLAYRDSAGVENVLSGFTSVVEDVRLGTVTTELIFTESGQSAALEDKARWPHQNVSGNGTNNYDVPAGGVVVGWQNVITSFVPGGCCTPATWTRTTNWRYKPLQKQVSGSWVTVSG